MKLVFSPVFETDFAGGVEYLAQEASGEIVTRWENAVYGTIGQLQKHPSPGRLRRDLHPSDIRIFTVRGFPRHLVFYTIREKELFLLRVKHGAMNLQALFTT
jgi:plasmid stabilization system protein ParE